MRKAEVPMTLKKGSEERTNTVAPSSPKIPTKRIRVTPDQVVPESEDSVYPTPTPPVFIRKMRNAAVGTGCDVRLKVAIAGHPQPSLYWYHNDVLLDTGGQEYGGLWVRDCRASDAGLYTCVANNRLGEVRSSAVLAVLDLGEDSENTEDETAEPQIPMEPKGESGSQANRATRKGDRARDVPGGLDAARGCGPHSRSPNRDAVVEKEEVSALGSRAPGLQEPPKPGRQANAWETTGAQVRHLGVEPLMRASRANLSRPAWGSQSEDALREAQSQVWPYPTLPPPQISQASAPAHFPSHFGSVSTASHSPRKKATIPTDYQDTVAVDFEDKIKQPKPSTVSHGSGQDSRPQTPVSECSRKDLTYRPSPKPARTSSKIFEKVRAFEERRKSIDQPDGSISGRSWAGFNRAPSIDSDDGGSRLGISRESSREDLREALKADAAQRRSSFHQRASSLEDRPHYSQKVQEIENKFTEELQRIKKLVGKSHMKKSFSTDQLSQRGRQPLRKLEPIPPQVLQKLEDRERIQQQQEQEQEKCCKDQLSQKLPSSTEEHLDSTSQHLGAQNSSRSSASVRRFGEKSVSPDDKLPFEFIDQCSPQQKQRSCLTKSTDQTPASQLLKEKSPPRRMEPSTPRVDLSPLRTSHKDCLHGQERAFHAPPKPPRLGSSSSPNSSPIPREEKIEVELGPVSLAPKLEIPTIIVEEEPMEEETSIPRDSEKKTEFMNEGKTQWKNQWVSQTQSILPEQGSTSKSNMSAGEDAMEAPVFEYPLQDTVVSDGSEVTLKCVITGTAFPEVTWKKGDIQIKNSHTHLVKAEDNRHSLLIKQTNTKDAGTYTVTAINKVGVTSCSATLFVESDSTKEHQQAVNLPVDISSAVTSDEEYLSLMEESMKTEGVLCQGPEPQMTVDARFKEPPSFEVPLRDRAVIEGEDITMSVRVHGQPKPMIYWLKGRESIKTAGRHSVREPEDSRFEMKITSVQKSDTGVYTCKIINEYGMKQCDCRLDVTARCADSGLTILRGVTDVTVKAGETALFECQVRGPSEVDVDWMANGKLIQPALLNCKMHFDGRMCRLLLNSVHEDDSGTYTCKLSTAKEELTSNGHLEVIPSTEPLFTRELDILEVIEGRTARFDCKVSGTPAPSVTWKHFGSTLMDSENVRILKESGRHSLVVAHACADDEGLYTAVARNLHGTAESAAELFVQEPRPAISSHIAKLEKMPSIPEEPEVAESEVERFTMPDFVKPLYDLDVVEGKEAVLRCRVAGLPYPTITWFHNGQKIDSTDERKMTQYRDIHSLVIRSACHAHAGVYKSVISNRVGKAACYAHLYVTDVLPEPPDGPPVVEVITGKIICLRWNKPKHLDPSIDAASLMYAIQQQILGSSQWTIIVSGLRQTSHMVTSLQKGVRYCFRVLSATNKAFSKPSPATEPLQLVDRGAYLQEVPVIIDKPDIVYMVEHQPVNITITLNHVQATVTWKRGGEQLLSKMGVFEMSMPDDDQHTLRIVKARASDVGQLICVASNQFGSDSCILTLDVATPPTFESIMEDLDVHMGESPRFVVVVEGKPVPDIMWYKDDVLLSESGHFTFVYDDSECFLVVLNTKEEDSGVYTCTAKNLAGSISCKAELTVHTAKQKTEEPMEDEETILRKMRRLTDYYDIHKEIGRGAFSYMKRVTQKATRADYAAKFISARAKRKTSALREMKVLSRLEHERIVYFHDAFEKKNVVVIITELCHEELLDRLTKKSCVMESEIRSCMRQLLEGLDYLHQNNILHLDIKPENILMADANSDQVRICDFGNAVELTPGEAQYCKYGTPEFIAPEIVNQTPVSKATDIWPVGVITYLCLTGVSPFAGENDRDTALNVRSYNVAFEEGMFNGVCREARGFVIKLLVADRLRPDTKDCLRHPWFKTLAKGKSSSTELLKKFLLRRKWQRSLISYKSKMVMRSIPQLLDDSSSHISIAVPRHLKEGSPPPSSSSDSDEDVDELPFIPMPSIMEFSGSRMSLNEIPADDEVLGRPGGAVEGGGPAVSVECGPLGNGSEGGEWARQTQVGEDGLSGEESTEAVKQTRGSLCRVSSVESDKAEGSRKRGELRRGSSADSALLLHITSEEEGATEAAKEDEGKNLKKAVSMELPRRSPSPGAGRLNQEDYALKLELMRQRLLRGSSVDNKMSGLRGPLLETLGIGDERRTSSLDRHKRPRRIGTPPLIKAASSDAPGKDTSKTKVLHKSASFTEGDSEPIPLHRRSGAPLEIPLAQREDRRLQEATSMSALTEQTRLDSRPVTPKEVSSKPPTPVIEEDVVAREESRVFGQNVSRLEEEVDNTAEGPEDIPQERTLSMLEKVEEEHDAEGQCKSRSDEPEKLTWNKPCSEVAPRVMPKQGYVDEEMIDDKDRMDLEKSKKAELGTQMRSPEFSVSSETLAVTPASSRTPMTDAPTMVAASQPTRVTLPDGRTSAYASIMQTITVPSLQGADRPTSVSTTMPAPTPTPVTAVTSVPTTMQIKPQPSPSMEHPAVFSKVASADRPAKSLVSPKTPTSPSLPREPTLNPNIKDIASEEIFEAKFKKRESSLTRGLRLLTRSKPEETPTPVPTPTGGEMVYRPGPAGAPLEFIKYETPRMVERAMSVQDLRETGKDSSFMRRLSMRLKKAPLEDRTDENSEQVPPSPEPAAPRRRVSWALGRSRSEDKKEAENLKLDGEVGTRQIRGGSRDSGKASDSPVLAMRRKIESTVAGISMKIRSQSEERKEERTSEEREVKLESRRTPLLSILRRSSSEGGSSKKKDIPNNQLAIQSAANVSMESLESTASIQSETAVRAGTLNERRSRWDRWGLGRSKKEKTGSQPDIPSAIVQGNGSLPRTQYGRLTSDFPPVFHIKLRDHILLEGDPVTLSCLPAGNPPPRIAWIKDKKPLEVDARMNMISCPDGRQLLMVMKTTKRDTGLYECMATNPLGSVTTSCTISLARLPNRPGTPEVPQKYKNTALVLWRPSDALTPCTYSLERKTEGEENWLIVATGLADCYYNVTDLPTGSSVRFRVACVNKAGQGPYSNVSEKVCLDSEIPKAPATVIVKTMPSAPSPATSALVATPFRPAPIHSVSTQISAPSMSQATPTAPAPGPVSASSASQAPPTIPTPAETPAVSKSIAPPTPPSTIQIMPSDAVPPFSTNIASPSCIIPEAHISSPVSSDSAKNKSTLNITMATPSPAAPPPARPAPPKLAPKLKSPINVVSPMAQSPPTSPPPLVSPPPALGKPISSLPTYVPVSTVQTAPPAPGSTLSPPVVLVTSLTPVGETPPTPTREISSGNKMPSGKLGETTLRQGVPQKPYTFLDEKHRGRFGVIRECRENATGTLFMAKIVPYEPETKQAVLQEYDFLKSLHHKNVMALHEAYITPRYLVLIAEHCPGKEVLFNLVDRFRYSEDDVVSYVVQVLQGLEYLHSRHILHLDIKPDNIIVSPVNVVKIVDFGSAQSFDPLFLKPQSRHLGTLEFMPPEMVKGDVVGPPADVWSLGVVTYIMLSGRLPFQESDPLQTEAKIQAAKFDQTKLYPNVSQSASLFLKKIMCSYPWARPTIKDCFSNLWLQDAYLMKLRRQTLTFTTTRLKEFLVQHQRRRAEGVTKHKVLLRSYQTASAAPMPAATPATPVTQ